MKLSIAVLAANASANSWLKKETQVQDAYFAGDDIVLSNPAIRSNKQWHDCGEAPPLPPNARAVECSGSVCAAVCPIGWRSQGRWKIKCNADNTWAHSKFSPCVTCPDMSDELEGIVEAENGAVYQEIFSEEQNLPITQFFCGKSSDALFIKNKIFNKGGAKRNVKCICEGGRNGDPAWKKSCGWEFRGKPWSPADVASVQCKTKTQFCEFNEDIYLPNRYNYRVVDKKAQFKDYFHISAPDFGNDIHLGFSNGFSGHDDAKWEIVIGGWGGTQHVIRDGNQTPGHGLVKKNNGNRTEYDQLRNNFIVQVVDGNIAVYWASESGDKMGLVLDLTDTRIKKGELNTLVASGGWGGSGTLNFNGVGCN